MEFKKGDYVEFNIVLHGKQYETTGEIFIYKSDKEIVIWKVNGLGGSKLSQCTIKKDDIIKKI